MSEPWKPAAVEITLSPDDTVLVLAACKLPKDEYATTITNIVRSYIPPGTRFLVAVFLGYEVDERVMVFLDHELDGVMLLTVAPPSPPLTP